MEGQDGMLPIANVGRLMKQILPPSAKVSKEAKETMQECATEFIRFVTGEASHKCHKENRKTVNGDDICYALRALGFDDHGDAIFKYLHKYRDYFEKQKDINKSNLVEATPHYTYDGKPNEVLTTTLELGGLYGN